jgi:tRNA G46 methylase TrmB
MKLRSLAGIPKRLLVPFFALLSPKNAINSWAKRDHLSALNYQSNIYKKSTTFIEDFVDFKSISSVIEVGSNSGPNLIALAEKFTETRFTGIDINEIAIELGRSYARENSLSNLDFCTLLKAFS